MRGADANRIYVDSFVGSLSGIRGGDSNAKSIRLRENCKLCIERMPDKAIPEQIMKYPPRGYRFIDRPRKRPSSYHFKFCNKQLENHKTCT